MKDDLLHLYVLEHRTFLHHISDVCHLETSPTLHLTPCSNHVDAVFIPKTLAKALLNHKL